MWRSRRTKVQFIQPVFYRRAVLTWLFDRNSYSRLCDGTTHLATSQNRLGLSSSTTLPVFVPVLRRNPTILRELDSCVLRKWETPRNQLKLNVQLASDLMRSKFEYALELVMRRLFGSSVFAFVTLVTALGSQGEERQRLTAPNLFPENTLAYVRINDVVQLKEDLGRACLENLATTSSSSPFSPNFTDRWSTARSRCRMRSD